MKTILSIDSEINKKIRVVIVGNKRYEKVEQIPAARAQVVLPLIEALLHEASLQCSHIDEIIVSDDATSFTGTRVKFAIANALGWLLHIPVNGKTDLAFPDYTGLQWAE